MTELKNLTPELKKEYLDLNNNSLEFNKVIIEFLTFINKYLKTDKNNIALIKYIDKLINNNKNLYLKKFVEKHFVNK